MPAVSLSEEAPFLDEEAEELVAACPLKVFDIEELASGQKKAVVSRPRDCNLCRECIRRPAWVDRVSLERVADHFICEWRRRLQMDATCLISVWWPQRMIR